MISWKLLTFVFAGLAVASLISSPAIAAVLAGPNTVDSAAIIDGQVRTNDIATGAVTNSDLANGAVSNTKIGNSAVTNSKIAAGAVSYSKLGNNTIDSSKIKDSSVGINDLASNSIDSGKIRDSSIEYGDLSNDVQKLWDKVYFVKSSGTANGGETTRIEVECGGDSGEWIGNPTPDYMVPDYLGIYFERYPTVIESGLLMFDFTPVPDYPIGAYIVIRGDEERSGGGATLEIMCINQPSPPD